MMSTLLLTLFFAISSISSVVLLNTSANPRRLESRISEILTLAVRRSNLANVSFFDRYRNLNYDVIGQLCRNAPDKFYLCNKPDNHHIFFNTKFVRNEIHLYSMKSNEGNGFPFKSVYLTTIANHRSSSRLEFPVQIHSGPIHQKQCKTFVRGTLHVIAPTMITNLFHVVNDNLLPFYIDIVLDYYLYPTYLDLPRYLVFVPDLTESMLLQSIPHMQLLWKVVDGIYSWKEVDQTCWSRVVWASGPRLFYHYFLPFLRRSASEVLRITSSLMFSLELPRELTRPSSQPSSSSLTTSSLTGLRIVIYSRGSSGVGRSISGENALVQQLRELGCLVILVGDDSGEHGAVVGNRDGKAEVSRVGSGSLLQQLAVAYHAHVMIGLHGAGLTHAVWAPRYVIVMEWKTVYGYSTNLFSLVTQSRDGIYVQIDCRSYHRNGGLAPIDLPFIQRNIQSLGSAVWFRTQVISTSPSFTMPLSTNTNCNDSHTSSNWTNRSTYRITKSPTMVDLLILPMAWGKTLQYDFGLGPLASQISDLCLKNEYWEYLQLLGTTASMEVCQDLKSKSKPKSNS